MPACEQPHLSIPSALPWRELRPSRLLSRWLRVPVLLLCCLMLSACGWFDSSERDEFEGLSNEEQFYRRALDQLNSSNFIGAIATYEALESRFPFGRFAAQAQIEIVYAYYRNGDMDAVRTAADRFIRLHPDDENVDYAHYMKGLSSFSVNTGLVNRFLPIDPTKRDPGRYEESFADFAELLALYPESAYSADARARMLFLRNNLAAYEIHVAEYYLKRHAYVAALRRGQYVVQNFQGTPAVADGIAIMIECYLRLGLNELAETSMALLQENYPQHASIDDNGEFAITTEIYDPSMLYIMTFGLLGDNWGNPPVAPTQRPVTPGGQQIIKAQEELEVQQEREESEGELIPNQGN